MQATTPASDAFATVTSPAIRTPGKKPVMSERSRTTRVGIGKAAWRSSFVSAIHAALRSGPIPAQWKFWRGIPGVAGSSAASSGCRFTTRARRGSGNAATIPSSRGEAARHWRSSHAGSCEG